MRSTKIGNKLLLGGLFLVCVPIILIGLISVKQTSQSLSSLAEQSLMTISRNLSTNIEADLSNELQLAKSVSVMDGVIALTEKQAAGVPLTKDDLNLAQPDLSKIKDIGGEHYSSILLVGTDELVFASSGNGRLVGLNLKGRKYLSKALQGTPNIGAVIFSRATGKPLTTVAVPIYSSKDKSIIGAVVIAIYIDRISEITSSVKVGNGGFSYVIDHRGLYITHPDKEKILKTDVKSVPGMETVVAYLQDSNEGIIEYSLDGVVKVAAITQARGVGWQIITSVPKTELLAPVYTLRNLILGIGLVFLLVAVGFFYRFSQGVTGSILELHDGVDVIASGDLDHEIYAGLKDEFGVLAKAFNGMSKKLKASRQQLEQEIVERKSAEEQIAEINKELKRSNEELEHFAFAASHDMQEPLRKVTAFGDRLQSHCRDALDERGKDYLDRMISASTRMAKLIDGLLEFARVSTQGQPFESVDVNAVLAEVLGDLEHRIQAEDGEVTVGDLPMIQGDRLQIRQLLQNLIGNALKFHTPGKPPYIEINVSPVNSELVAISIADNGIGIDEKYTDRIFKPFQRLHGRDEYEGTGMGLAICQRIITRHGGKLAVTSIPGGGSTFTITLAI